MTEPLRRDDILELLQQLGNEPDEEVLEAARRLHARIAEAGMAWDDLLVPDGADGDGDSDGDDTDDLDDTDDDVDADDTDDAGDADDTDDDDDTGHREPEGKDAEPPEEAARKNAESLALIDKLLAKSGLSGDLREELKGYKEDIAEGEFTKADRRYLRALSDRLTKGG